MDDATKNKIKEIITTSTFQDKAVGILQAATLNAGKLFDQKIRETTNDIRDDFDQQIMQKTRTEHYFKNNINQSNYDFCKQAEDIVTKVERAVDAKHTEKAKEPLEKGKASIQNRHNFRHQTRTRFEATTKDRLHLRF